MDFDAETYKGRNTVERSFSLFKQWRGIATLGRITAHATKATTPVKTATCTYSFAGKAVAQRTAAGGSVKLSLIVGDSVNTAQTMSLPTVGTGPITTIQRYTDPFGLARANNLTGQGNNTFTAAGATTAGVGSNAANPAGFGAVNGYIGGLDDTISSLTHLGARDLDPVTGAFTTPDPILDTSDQVQFSAYQYAGTDPINRSDSTGMWDFLDVLALAAGAALVVAGATVAVGGTVSTGGAGAVAAVPGGNWMIGMGTALIGASVLRNMSSLPAPALLGSGSSAGSSGVGGSLSYQPAVTASSDVFISYPTSGVRTVAGGVKGGYVAAALGGQIFTSPGARQGAQSTADTRGANTGAALAAQNAVMHAASVEATARVGRAAQAAVAACRHLHRPYNRRHVSRAVEEY